MNVSTSFTIVPVVFLTTTGVFILIVCWRRQRRQVRKSKYEVIQFTEGHLHPFNIRSKFIMCTTCSTSLRRPTSILTQTIFNLINRNLNSSSRPQKQFHDGMPKNHVMSGQKKDRLLSEVICGSS